MVSDSLLGVWDWCEQTWQATVEAVSELAGVAVGILTLWALVACVGPLVLLCVVGAPAWVILLV